MHPIAKVCVPARRGKAIRLAHGKIIRVINTYGQQVVDTWAFRHDDLHEFMSMEHTRAVLSKLMPEVGDNLYTNQRRPILTMLEDTSPGIHDTLIAACDRYRYELLGYDGHHDNCTDNLRVALSDMGLTPLETPCPLNLFMNIPIQGEKRLSFEPPLTRPGDYVALRAEMECVLVFSACPQDMVPVNGTACTPTDVHCEILSDSASLDRSC